MSGPVLRRRSPAEALRYLADRLMTGTDPAVVAMTLLSLAAELEGAEWPALA